MTIFGKSEHLHLYIKLRLVRDHNTTISMSNLKPIYQFVLIGFND